MKIQLLYEFVLLSDMLNFTKASQNLNITQPVLSRHMKCLEEQIGAELFKRDTHLVKLTSCGSLLYSEAKKIINQYESSIDVLNTFTGKSRRKISITFLGEAVHQVLIDFLSIFNEKHPDIQVECRDSELDEALDFLEHQICDIGFLLRPSFVENKVFDSLYISSDSINIAVNKYHPLAKQKIISLREIENWPVIRVNENAFNLSHEYSTEFLDRYQIQYHVEKEYPNLKTCCFNLEFNHRAVLLMPKHRSYLLSENCVLLDLKEDKYWFESELVWDRKNNNPCIPIFLKQFKAFLQDRKMDRPLTMAV